MRLSNEAIDRRATVFVLLAAIVVMGVYSYIVLPRESSPEVVIPYISVIVTYEGVAPEDMESLVTSPIERKLAGLSGVKEMKSTSIEGTSSILIEFSPDTDIEDALQRVRDKVDMAEPDLPQDADDPVISELNVSEFPIIRIALAGNIPLAALNSIAEDIEDRLETIKGVLDVEIVGGVEREIQVEVDPQRMAEYGVAFTDLILATQLENVNTPAGTMDLGEAKFLVRTPGEFASPEEINNLVIKQGQTGAIYLRDVASARDGFKELASLSRVNGVRSVSLTVSKRSGENIVEVADQVRQELETMRADFPQGVDIAIVWDESDWVRDMVSELENSILSGLILVLLVVFAFLGFTNAVFVSLAIPVSMLITFSVLKLWGVTLNMVVLFSLTLSLGMLVDNGIVVVENIYRHAQMGMGRIEAAKKGAAEVAWPIFGSTMTTVAAFCPMFFWPGIWGEFMFYLPQTVSIALLASLFVGLVVNPALASAFMRIRQPKRSKRPQAHPIIRAYGRVLRLALQWRAVTVTLALTLLLVIGVVFFSTSETEFVPTVEPPQADITVKCPEGTNLDTSDRYVRRVEQIAAPYRDNIDYVIANVGSTGMAFTLEPGGNATHISTVTLDFLDLEDCEIWPSAVINKIRGKLDAIVGAELRIEKMGMGPPTGPPINIEITGDDFDVLAQMALDIKQRIKDVPGLVDLRDDYNKGKPEARVIVDRRRAWQLGLNTQLIGQTVKAAVNGVKAAEYREGDEEYDVTVRFPDEFRENLRNLETMNLINAAGRPIPFSAVARIEQGAGLGSITRIDRRRTVTVSAELDEGYLGPMVLAKVQQKLSVFPLPPGYALAYTGEDEDTQETKEFLGSAFVAAILLITLVLVTQFNSITQPLIIMSSVILSLAGVFLGLWLFDMPFGILMTGIGCISLAGVVVNNAIVLLDFINQLRTRGKPTTDAIVEAGMIRFRPVMLTAVTTVLGLIPMATGVSFDFRELRWIVSGESSQWWGPMAIAVIFGISFATVLTLIVVPTLYSINISLVEFATGRRRASGAENAEVPGQ